MISVIVPTMWKYAPFVSFLEQVVNHKLVGEVIVINNYALHTPESEMWNHAKVIMHDFAQNIFVNPAWNVGAHTACNPLLCIMNDDLIFDTQVFDLVYSQFDTHQGCCAMVTHYNSGPLGMETHSQQNQAPLGFGQLMFIHKQNWIDIPSELNVLYGDSWIWDTQFARWGQNQVIKNLIYVTPQSVTSRDFTPQCMNVETQNALELWKKYQLSRSWNLWK
jgi:hypothetical protein